MDKRKPSRDERHFVFVVKLAAALGLGIMAAFLFSLKQVHPHVRLEFTVGTLVAFLAASSLSWMFIGVLFQGEFDGDDAQDSRKRRVRRWIILFCVTAGLLTVGAFGYALKDVAAEGRRDVIEGTAIAVVVLSMGGFLIHKAIRFFEEQDKIGLEQQRRDDDEEE